jgi:hypothetical protein
MAEETALPADPRLARLRVLLSQARACGVDFASAWPAARGAALRGLSRFDRETYSRALAGTEEAWRSAYEGTESSRVDWAVSELGAYASDGELASLGVG